MAAMFGDANPNDPWVEFVANQTFDDKRLHGDKWLSECLLFALCERPRVLAADGPQSRKGRRRREALFGCRTTSFSAAVRRRHQGFQPQVPSVARSGHPQRKRPGSDARIVRHHDPDMPERYPETVELITDSVSKWKRPRGQHWPRRWRAPGGRCSAQWPSRSTAPFDAGPGCGCASMAGRRTSPRQSTEECLVSAGARVSPASISRDPFIKSPECGCAPRMAKIRPARSANTVGIS